MEVRQVRYFLAVARNLSFTRAAETLNLSQPPLSLQIRKLEDEIGAPLFVRAGHSVHLTAAGESFVPHAERILAELDAAISTARETARGIVGSLHLGFVGSASHTIVPRIARHLRDRHPKARLVLSDRSNSELLSGLAMREIDMAILRAPADTSDFQTLSILREPFVAVVAEDHPLAGRESVTLRELASAGLVINPRHIAPALYDTIMQQFVRSGLEPRINHVLRGLQTILDIVAAGLGAAMLPQSVRDLRPLGLAYIQIADATAEAELRMACHRDAENPLIGSVLSIFGQA